MFEFIDASTGDDASGEGKPATHSRSSTSLNARAFSAMMYREASLRASIRPACRRDEGAVLAGIYLTPKMAFALKALLRGDAITAQERAALFKAASLRSTDESKSSAPLFSRQAVWAGMTDAANSNDPPPNPKRYRVVPLQPHRVMDRADNHVLQRLGLSDNTLKETS